MRKLLIAGVLQLFFVISVSASDHIFVSAIPTQVHIIPEGLMLVGNFKNTGVSCAGTLNSKSILLSKDDPMFSHKVSLALAASMSLL